MKKRDLHECGQIFRYLRLHFRLDASSICRSGICMISIISRWMSVRDRHICDKQNSEKAHRILFDLGLLITVIFCLCCHSRLLKHLRNGVETATRSFNKSYLNIMTFQSLKLLRSYDEAVLTQVVFFVESRVCEIAAQNSWFVRAFEEERIDCVLCIGFCTFSSSSSDKTFALLNFIDRKQLVRDLIAIDCKNISARTNEEVNIFWGIDLIDYQRQHCQFLIFISVIDSDFIVLLFTRYVKFRDQYNSEIYEAIFYGSRGLWILISASAFLSQLTSFALFLSQLRNALTQIRNFAIDLEETLYLVLLICIFQ